VSVWGSLPQASSGLPEAAFRDTGPSPPCVRFSRTFPAISVRGSRARPAQALTAGGKAQAIMLPQREEVDAKAWFYLDHRQDIETWAALRDDASRLVDRYLVALAPTFEELAVELDAEPEFGEDLESGQ
jgi:hypothetical protein